MGSAGLMRGSTVGLQREGDSWFNKGSNAWLMRGGNAGSLNRGEGGGWACRLCFCVKLFLKNTYYTTTKLKEY